MQTKADRFYTAFVIDPRLPRFGASGAATLQSGDGTGTFILRFDDGTMETYVDGFEPFPLQPPQIFRFYRSVSPETERKFGEALVELRNDILPFVAVLDENSLSKPTRRELQRHLCSFLHRAAGLPDSIQDILPQP